MKEEIKNILEDLKSTRKKVINMILKYLDSCDKELDFDIEYYGETIRISGIKNKMLIAGEDISDIVGYHDGDKIDYREFDFDELTDLFYDVSSF